MRSLAPRPWPLPQAGLIVSIQPVAGGPLDAPEIVARYAEAVTAGVAGGGAVALRVQGRADIAAVAARVDVPIIGLVKSPFGEVATWITGSPADIDAVAASGAAIVAIDATDRPRPAPFADLVRHARMRGLLVLADVSTLAEGLAAEAEGADAVASTLSGYTPASRARPSPDLGLVADLARRLTVPVIAEGNIRSPAEAAAALAAGAHAVVVGSAITRPEHVTGWFRDALASGAGHRLSRGA